VLNIALWKTGLISKEAVHTCSSIIKKVVKFTHCLTFF